MKNVIQIESIRKNYEGFTLVVENLKIPMGFTTVVVGENGAGKTTLLKILAGIDHDYQGTFDYFDETNIHDVTPAFKKQIAFGANKEYYNPIWKVKQVINLSKVIFDDFDEKEFKTRCEAWNVGGVVYSTLLSKRVGELSDGNMTKLVLSNVFARRNTNVVLLDEPSASLDPLMKEALKDRIQEYVASGNGDKTAIVSTHDVNDIEVIADYVVVIEDGHVLEACFVDELKEKYVYVKGENTILQDVKPYMYTLTTNSFGFEGMVKIEDVKYLEGYDLVFETPNLNSVVVNIMKHHKEGSK